VRRCIACASLVVIGSSGTLAADDAEHRGERERVRITVVFNNVPLLSGLETSWGFAAVIETPAHTVLFDTGGNGTILLANMERLGIEPERIEAVVLSHIHADHTGGLERLVERNAHVTVYLPATFPPSFTAAVKARGIRVETVGARRHLLGPFYSTGEMGSDIKEQALIIDTAAGLIVMTGCAHPQVAEMAATARAYLGKEIDLLMGGFHMGGMTYGEIRRVMNELKRLGVRKVAPSHCTGDRATAAFQEAWGPHCIAGGCGAVIEVPP
jgi:7,8-dihydropterin-6-yl-methyl-4-(beta-D-ribofuranosyl)aminobenzene 5'-phosphate synthase